MDNPRPDKVAVVDEVRSHLDEADAVIVTEYRGLKVKDLAALRRSIAPLGADYKIYKNTLVRLAAEQRPDGFVDLVSGPTALTFVQGDAAAVTKALRDFARANPLLVIKGGLLGNSVLGAQATAALADLPSREVLLARLAGALAAPMQSLAGLLAAVPRNFAYGLAALRDERAAGAPIPEVTSAAGSTSAPSEEPASAEAPATGEAPATEEAPAAEAPAAEAPEVEAPEVEAPAAEAPAAEAPEAEAPEAEAPEAEAPAAESPAEETDGAETVAAEATTSELEAAEPQAAEPEAAEPEAAEPEAAEPESPATES
jgi:large subunit ribosomal protein L10